MFGPQPPVAICHLFILLFYGKFYVFVKKNEMRQNQVEYFCLQNYRNMIWQQCTIQLTKREWKSNNGNCMHNNLRFNEHTRIFHSIVMWLYIVRIVDVTSMYCTPCWYVGLSIFRFIQQHFFRFLPHEEEEEKFNSDLKTKKRHSFSIKSLES